MNLAKLWFWATVSSRAMTWPNMRSAIDRYCKCHEFRPSKPPQRMDRDVVANAKMAVPIVWEHWNEFWPCTKWLAEIEAAQAREAHEAELAAKQVGLFT